MKPWTVRGYMVVIAAFAVLLGAKLGFNRWWSALSQTDRLAANQAILSSCLFLWAVSISEAFADRGRRRKRWIVIVVQFVLFVFICLC